MGDGRAYRTARAILVATVGEPLGDSLRERQQTLKVHPVAALFDIGYIHRERAHSGIVRLALEQAVAVFIA